MYGRKHIHRVAALLTAVAALAFFAGSVQAASSRPAGMTKAEYRALMLRSEALNRQHGLGSGTYKPAAMNLDGDRALVLRSKALNRQYALGSGTSKPAAMSPDGYRALVLRSKALNAKYGLGGAHLVASTQPAVTVAENGFVWGDFAIGAAGMLGVVLVATSVIAATRRIPRTRVSS
jgi:hypothetical protein